MVSINVKKADASETDPLGAGLGQMTVRRSGDTAGNLDVSVRFSPGASTATWGEDVRPIVKTVRIRAGRSYAHFDIIPIDDAIGEPRETVVMKLHPSPAYTINPARPKVRVFIYDNEPTVGIFATKPSASETDPAGGGAGQFEVRRTGSTAQPLTVGYYVRNTSTAVSGQDFQPLPGSITIPAGQSSVAFSLVPIDDTLPEPAETVTLTIRFDEGIYRFPHSATVTITDNDASRAGWWDDAWNFRVPITVSAGSHARTEKPVEQRINFTELFAAVGASGPLIEQSIRVLETSADGLSVLNDSVPFQFDRDGNFNAASNASGTLVFLMTGTTGAAESRHYHVYFDRSGSFAAPGFTQRVSVTDNVIDEGYNSLRIETTTATYFYQKAEGGFSSIVDVQGNDWVSWNSGTNPASAGEFRGVPNIGPAGFHPGRDHDVTTLITSQGPLKITITSVDPDNNRIRWEFFPEYARATVLNINQPYYFLYEGTPGGAIDGGDFVVRSDGTQTNINTAWNLPAGLGSSNGEQWVYFADGGLNRYFFLVQHENDHLEDSYLNLDGNMTVFGFGRRNNPGAEPNRLLTATPRTFTIGLASDTAFASASPRINAAYRDLSTSASPPQTRVG